MNTSNALFLVTGASGFIGGRMVALLREEGVAVRAMARDPEKAGALRALGAEVVEGDVRDEASLARAVSGVTGIYHIAGAFRRAALSDRYYYEVNAEGVRKLLDAAVAAGVRRFVHCSTIGVLGHIANPPANENTAYNPGDTYQSSKLEGEKIALGYFASGKMRGVVIRPAMVYGPGDARMRKLFAMIAKGRFFYVGRGDAYVHFVDVRDLTRAFLLAMRAEHLNNEIFIIAGERALPLNEFVGLIAGHLGVRPPWLHVPVRPMQLLGSVCEMVCKPFGVEPPIFRRRVDFFTKNRSFDTAKARDLLGYRPARTLEKELQDILDWYVQHGLIRQSGAGRLPVSTAAWVTSGLSHALSLVESIC